MKDDTSIVVNCPTCKAVIWRGSTCSHGQVPKPKEPQPKVSDKPPVPPTKKKR